MYTSNYSGEDRKTYEELISLSGELPGLQPVISVKYQAGVTLEVVPLSPDSKQTLIFFRDQGANVVINDLRDGREGDRVVLINESTPTVTLNATNAKLASGAAWVGTQYDTITLIFSSFTGFWLELSRSSNA